MKETPLRVLLIEDDEDDYILTSEVLREVKGANYAITWVSKYAEALPAMTRGDHDVCFVDYRLGEGDGISLMTRAIDAGCRLPMILLTGQGDREIDIKATEAGAADYLVKGEIEASVLERTIRYAVARARMLETLSESEVRFRSVVESANDAIILTDYRGYIISWNKTAQRIFGYSQPEILGQALSVLFPSEYYRRISDTGDIDPLLASGLLHPDSRAIELYGLTKNGTQFPIEISLSSWETAKGTFYSGIVRDITERKSLEHQLTHQALHDPLTKLPNRILFRDRVQHSLERAGRSRAPVAVLFLDLDNFKAVNDTYGHEAGDQLLVSMAERVQACLRLSDTAARLGGDEFAILIEDSPHADGPILVAERIKDVLRAPFTLNGREIFIDTSIGIAATLTGNETPEELLRNADVAMYTAKSQGKDRYAVFQNEMHETLLKRAELEAELRRAIDAEEFVLHYQPILDLQSKLIMGMEALVRWDNPRTGLIPPSDFIPIAEECNLMTRLGRWVLEEACKQARIWQEKFDRGSHLSITVNVSSRQFQQKDLVEVVVDVLNKTGLSPRSLILEITESTMLQNTEATIRKLQDLKQLGVRLAIDDFGTGYSSLSYLQRFPVDILKIDKSFIDKINHSSEGAAVARAIITMGDTLRLRTIAEGIETADQTAALQRMGCELGQGYLFAKPLSKDDMNLFLNEATLNENTDHITNPIGNAGQVIEAVM